MSLARLVTLVWLTLLMASPVFALSAPISADSKADPPNLTSAAGGGTVLPGLPLGSQQVLAQETRLADLRQGFEVGALLLTTLLALLFGLWLREPAWLWYGAASAGALVYVAGLTGMADLWLWPGQPQWMPPAMLWVLAGMHEYSALLLPLVLPLLVWHAWRAWRTGDKAARFLLIGYGVLAIASMLRLGVAWEQIPRAHWIEDWFLPLSALLPAIVILRALTDRLRVLSQQQRLYATRDQAALQSSIQQATAELMEARNQAQASSQFKSRFMSRVSHDLRTPLHTLLGNAELAQRYLEQSEAQETGLAAQRLLESVRAMERSGKDMLQLSEELLDFLRGEEGKLNLVTGPASLTALAQETASDARWLAQRQGNRLQLDTDLTVPVVEIDAVRVQQVLRNLLDNACAATRNGVITLGLRSAATPVPGMAQLDVSVSDTGRGISPEALERIFEPFEQLGAGNATGSSGLGLAIARHWVRLMGSDITVQSSPGIGTVFSWTMQVPIADPSDLVTPTLAAPPTAVGDGPLRGHVLVVDADVDQQHFLQQALQDFGLQVTPVTSGQAAVNVLSDTTGPRVDLVLTQQNMDDGDGHALLQWCRQNYPALAVVALLDDGQQTGQFDSALRKPVSIALLKQALQRQLPPPLDWCQLRDLAELGDGLAVDAWIARHRDRLGDGAMARGVIRLASTLQLAALVRWLQ